MKIIERDVGFYEGEVDRCKTELRRCEPKDEDKWREAVRRAEKVVRALKHFALYL